jgi:large subunit ribosomal protein L30|tara:strand:+ start:1162 stop:1632 length:471 start_codon:yes stop_codon:yes gene_type:complete
MNKIAIIRIAGKQGLNEEIKRTFNLLNLFKKYNCVVVPYTPQYLGMMKKVKDFITWGEIDEPTFKLLLEKRGKVVGNVQLTEEYLKNKTKLSFADFSKEFMENKKKLKDIEGIKPSFRLHPPVGGFERKGTKKPFSLGGVLGYRKEKINELIQKMI